MAVLLLSAALCPAQSVSEPTAAIDTTMGRIVCSLFAAVRPGTTANFIGLAEGKIEWSDPVTGTATHGRPFYDGTRLYGIPAGIRGGSRGDEGEKPAVPRLPRENTPSMRFARPGLLAMRGSKGVASGSGSITSTSEFVILDHADAEMDGQGAVIFGECDQASVKVVAAISHSLLAADNQPVRPVAINHITIVREGQAMPPVAKDRPPTEVVPAMEPLAAAMIPAPEPTGPVALIQTTMGKIACRLFTKESPIATAVFMGLAEGTKSWTNPVTKKVETGKRFYDGMPFDRVIPDFVIQNGDPTGDISGATDIGFRFKNENTPGLSYDRPGRLAFGNNGPDTNNSEIFITEHPMRRLDGGFTIIGQCDEPSVRVVEAIARVPRDKNNRPLTPVKIVTVRFEGR